MSEFTKLYDTVTTTTVMTKSNDTGGKAAVKKLTPGGYPVRTGTASRIDYPRDPGPVKNKDIKSLAEPLSYQIVDDKEIKFTRDEAAEFLKLKVFESERPVRESNVQVLYDEWKMGRFLWQNVTLAAAQLNGDTYRINGQHTSWMRLNINESIGPKVRYTLYKVQSAAQLRALYSSFDRGAPRTPGHIGRVLLTGTPAAAGIPQSYLTHMIAGYRMFTGAPSTRVQRVSIAELVAQIVKRHTALFNQVGAMYVDAYENGSWIRRAAVLGAMMATVDKAGIDVAKRFWEPVLHGIGLQSKRDVRWQIHQFILKHKMNRPIIQEELYATILTAWNYWRNNENPKMVRTAQKAPKVK